MSVLVNYPGVYIDEFQPVAPIQGASTSVAAFLGANAYGPPNKPMLITSWDEFLRQFALPAPTPPDDDDYLWYAVRGFFENGGQTCYVTAITNATPDSLALLDGNSAVPANTIKVTARRSGALTPQVQVMSTATHVVTTANIYAPTEPLTSDTPTLPPPQGTPPPTLIKVANPEKFLAGDALVIFDTASQSHWETVTVAYTDTEGVHVTTPLTKTYTVAKSAAIKLAPFVVGANSFRVSGSASAVGPQSLVVGTIITLTQAAPTPQGGGQPPPAQKQSTVITAVRAERISTTLTTYRVTVKDALAGFALDPARPVSIQSEEFTLSAQQGASPTKDYPDLSMSATHPRYYAKVINDDPNGLINVEPYLAPNGAPNATALPNNRPIQGAFAQLGGGTTHSLTALQGGNEYVIALAALAPIKDVSIVAIPDRTDATVQGALLTHCSSLYDRVAIFDPQPDADLTGIQTQQSSLQDTKGFGALYYPRIEVASVKTGGRILVPPSGHVAGVYARTDINRGVFKAPAGNDAAINGALGVEKALTDAQQGIINLKGINVIRAFSRGGRPIVWGARTTSIDTNWQYINIRRLFLFLEESIQIGIRGAVFEPNNTFLWQRLKRTIGAFLTQQWRDGALFGATVEEAFYVRVDQANNPDSERALGRLHIEIGVRPSCPAEFIVVHIGIWQGGSAVSEA